jgi:predicted lipoprotein with Yx(FWY)xxD motif
MKRLLVSSVAVVAGVLLGACGSSSGSSTSTGANTPAGTPNTLSVKQINGMGVLVDSTGKALYSPDQEAAGKILCTGACTAFWMPLTPGPGSPTAAAGVHNLGVIQRPDGTQQVTENGRPLYTFSEDSPGTLKGDGFSDAFGSQRFTWHAVLPGSSGGAAPNSTTTTGGANSGGRY